ncbi:MAG TPA: DUF1326 domain-containing protein [Rubrivivax sp.]|nr:DUF1326 domain-containing protein [Rubrivivax sp.]
MASWQIRGEYMETCNCTLLCPCITSNLAALPTEGDCKAAVALRIDQGAKDGVSLDGCKFIVMLHAPGAMGAGNMRVGLIVDQAASDAQLAAITGIATGADGGPMAALAPLVGSFAGVERRPIDFDRNGLKYAVRAGELVDQACDGLPSVTAPGQALAIDHVAHPVNSRLSLAKAVRSRFDVFGIAWNDSSGTRNGHFAPFEWAA